MNKMEELQKEQDKIYHVYLDRSFVQPVFQEFLDKTGLNDTLNWSWSDYSCEKFDIAPYLEYGDERMLQPNFHYKPTGFKLQWYKYPLRSPQANMEISNDEFKAMIEDCTQWYLTNVKKEE